jgi:3'-phosphoadenosine 5'-phosphosulfate sulfotransferase (PAPS reductase)/FAD synthetase
MRIVVWFSCGKNSAVAGKLALQKYKGKDIHFVYCDTGGEHPDNKRFLEDCEKWFGQEIEILKNPKYSDHIEVCEKERFIVSPNGARCTVELKKRLRFEYQQPDDIQVFGYTLDEQDRAKRFNEAYPEIETDFILIDEGLTEENCLGILWQSGIEIPEMYKMGYNHNNCLGCVKGGMGYWNQIRKDFPEVFTAWQNLKGKSAHALTTFFLTN